MFSVIEVIAEFPLRGTKNRFSFPARKRELVFSNFRREKGAKG